jgi:ADP-heptose:LPS heptosyltransferase
LTRSPSIRKGLSIAQALLSFGGGARRRVAKALIARASAERELKNYYAAAVLYDEALRFRPEDFGTRVQCGHMFKEAGDLARAETHYLRAQELSPDDPDLALQLGHFYKIAGRADASLAAYRRALELSPGWTEPKAELARLEATGGVSLAQAPSPDPIKLEGLAPELFPASRSSARTFVDSIHVRRLGSRIEHSRWGLLRTLRGVEAIRGFCISAEPIDEVRVDLGGRVVHRERPFAVELDAAEGGQRKFVFNLWFDVSGLEPGHGQLQLRFLNAGREVQSRREHVAIAPPLLEADYPDSDGVVTLSPGDSRPVEAQINARPSVVRSALRSVLPSEPRNILVLRTDQLGDLVVSVPAARRLRELFPGARLVGLLTPANADFARSAKLFDEIIVVEFPEDPLERRRIMPAETQQQLRRQLEPYAFDIAIDLSESGHSRPLLRLSGARFLYGFNDRDWPWLSAGFDGGVHDPRNHLDAAPVSTKALALVERLGAALNSQARIERRPELRREQLRLLGLGDGDRYAVLHAGARLTFSRWPHFGALAARMLERTDLKVVLLTDGAVASLTEAARSDRLLRIDGRLDFDVFDALISFCRVFVGNDSGPKHLAALRGAPVVSIHSGRLNWNEWGQELSGSIISRRVPCAGCAISHDSDECGKDFACIKHISVDEVFGAVADAIRTETLQD